MKTNLLFFKINCAKTLQTNIAANNLITKYDVSNQYFDIMYKQYQTIKPEWINKDDNFLNINHENNNKNKELQIMDNFYSISQMLEKSKDYIAYYETYYTDQTNKEIQKIKLNNNLKKFADYIDYINKKSMKCLLKIKDEKRKMSIIFSQFVSFFDKFTTNQIQINDINLNFKNTAPIFGEILETINKIIQDNLITKQLEQITINLQETYNKHKNSILEKNYIEIMQKIDNLKNNQSQKNNIYDIEVYKLIEECNNILKKDQMSNFIEKNVVSKIYKKHLKNSKFIYFIFGIMILSISSSVY